MSAKLFFVCSLFALSLAALAPYGTNIPTGQTQDTNTGSSQANVNINFPMYAFGATYSSVTASINGVVFPNSAHTLAQGSTVPIPLQTSTVAAFSPYWSAVTQVGANGTMWYRTITYSASLNSADQALVQSFASQISTGFTPQSMLIVTWAGMINPNSPLKPPNNYNNFQIIILSSTNAHSWVFFRYGAMYWPTPPSVSSTGGSKVAVGYTDGTGANGIYFNAPTSANTTTLVTTTDFFFYASGNPVIDVNNVASLTTNYKTISSQLIAQTVNIPAGYSVTGPFAFNFFKRHLDNTGAAKISTYATPGSRIYVYKASHPYTGLASQIAADYKNAYAMSTPAVSLEENLWEFSGRITFYGGQSYIFYVNISEPATGSQLYLGSDSSPSSNTNKRSAGTAYIASPTGSYVAESSATTFAYNFANLLVASASNDPIFKGLRSRESFEFDGAFGEIFNIYHDAYININAMFAYANPQEETGTVMDKFGITAGGHQISFGVFDFADNIITVSIDGKVVKVDSAIHLSGCIDLEYTGATQTLVLNSPDHRIAFYKASQHNQHISTSFINLNMVEVPEADNILGKIGGVLGQTAYEQPMDLTVSHYQVDTLFGTEKSPSFDKTMKFDC